MYVNGAVPVTTHQVKKLCKKWWGILKFRYIIRQVTLLSTASRAGISLYNVSVHTAHAGPQTSFSTAVLLYSFFFFFCCHAGINPELLCCVCRHHHTIHGRFGLSANAVLYRLPVITADDIPHKFDYRHTYTHTERNYREAARLLLPK